jgi:hypothetical protein
VEPLEFTSSGGRGETLSRQVKSLFRLFTKVSKIDNYQIDRLKEEGRRKNIKEIIENE